MSTTLTPFTLAAMFGNNGLRMLDIAILAINTESRTFLWFCSDRGIYGESEYILLGDDRAVARPLPERTWTA